MIFDFIDPLWFGSEVMISKGDLENTVPPDVYDAKPLVSKLLESVREVESSNVLVVGFFTNKPVLPLLRSISAAARVFVGSFPFTSKMLIASPAANG